MYGKSRLKKRPAMVELFGSGKFFWASDFPHLLELFVKADRKAD
jgi:predicted TIM-barrel fold metal-dependent hydrolase